MPVVRCRSLRRAAKIAPAILLAFALLPRVNADTILLRDGDRVTGKVTSAGKKVYRITTAYGRLVVPIERIVKVTYDDGREEVFIAPPPPTPPPPETIRLDVFVSGDSFWQAWPPQEAPDDRSLRLVVSLDEDPLVAYVDSQLDNDIPGAVVNTFVFDPTQTERIVWGQAHALPPETKPGQVRLGLELPVEKAGHHSVVLVYQSNDGTTQAPTWKDLRGSSIEVDLAPKVVTTLRLDQSRGGMNFGGVLRRNRMRKTETFRMQISSGPPSVAEPPPQP
jgi:hypothetical protein